MAKQKKKKEDLHQKGHFFMLSVVLDINIDAGNV